MTTTPEVWAEFASVCLERLVDIALDLEAGYNEGQARRPSRSS
jgi:hypothetical protein